MSSIKAVTVAGASGTNGASIVEALVEAGFKVQILSRKDSKYTNDKVKVIKVDYEDKTSLEEALAGQDAVVCAFGHPMGAANQNALTDAAIAAGVSRFIPSEFGSDLANKEIAAFPYYGSKIAAEKKLQDAASAHPSFSYTIIRNNLFLDWAIVTMPAIINIKGSGFELYDGGDKAFSGTTLETVGKSVAGVLLHPEETKNRAVYVHDGVVTQNQIIGLAEKETGTTFSPKPVDTAELEKETWTLCKDPNSNKMQWVFGFIKLSIWGRMAAPFQKVDNELLGIPVKSGAELDELLLDIIHKAQKAPAPQH